MKTETVKVRIAPADKIRWQRIARNAGYANLAAYVRDAVERNNAALTNVYVGGDTAIILPND